MRTVPKLSVFNIKATEYSLGVDFKASENNIKKLMYTKLIKSLSWSRKLRSKLFHKPVVRKNFTDNPV